MTKAGAEGKSNPGEMKRFLVAGLSAVATDTTVYWLMLHVAPPSVSKSVSFIAGTMVAYILNKFWTFKKPDRSSKEVFKFALLYLTTLGANVFVNRLVLDWAARLLPVLAPYTVQFGFLCATGTSTILNFLGQKFWVFKASREETSS